MSEDYIARLMAAKALKNGGGEQVDSYSKAEVDEKLSGKADVEDLSNYATTQTLTEELAKKAEISDTAISRQTLGYECRNLFDFDAWFSSIKSVNGTNASFSKSNGNGITIKSGLSTDAYTRPYGDPTEDKSDKPYTIPVFPNTNYILSYNVEGTGYRVEVFYITNIGEKYKTYMRSTGTKISFKTDENTHYITVRFSSYNVINNTVTFSNIQLQLANAKTDDTYQPYTPTVNDRLLALENPNIPVLKKRRFSNITTDQFGHYNTYITSGIPIACYSDDVIAVENEQGDSIVCIPFVSRTRNIVIDFTNIRTRDRYVNTSINNITLYYLGIPSGYDIPEDTTTASSDETEDDIGILQENEAEQEFLHVEE